MVDRKKLLLDRATYFADELLILEIPVYIGGEMEMLFTSIFTLIELVNLTTNYVMI